MNREKTCDVVYLYVTSIGATGVRMISKDHLYGLLPRSGFTDVCHHLVSSTTQREVIEALIRAPAVLSAVGTLYDRAFRQILSTVATVQVLYTSE